MTRATGSVAAGGVEIVYQSTGRGTAVMCVQGVGVAASGWDAQVAALAARYRVPACGRAIADGIPQARFVEIEDASHALTIQHENRVNALLLEHLDAVR